MISSIALTDPMIFSGLLIGGMMAYTFSYRLMQSIVNVSPVLCYDIKNQI